MTFHETCLYEMDLMRHHEIRFHSFKHKFSSNYIKKIMYLVWTSGDSLGIGQQCRLIWKCEPLYLKVNMKVKVTSAFNADVLKQK